MSARRLGHSRHLGLHPRYALRGGSRAGGERRLVNGSVNGLVIAVLTVSVSGSMNRIANGFWEVKVDVLKSHFGGFVNVFLRDILTHLLDA